MRNRRPRLIDRALIAKRESRRIEFKTEVDLSQKRSSCEFLKDVLAMANSGPGVMVIGLNDDGSPSGISVQGFLTTDPATLTNLVNAYTGQHYSAFEIREHRKNGNRIASIELGAVPVPLIPIRPGTFENKPGKQISAFSAGVVYVRHGAKSEPGTTRDLEAIIERRLKQIRKAWLGGLRKVVAAPADSVISVAARDVRLATNPAASEVRLTDRPDAPEFQLVDPDRTHPHRMLEFLPKLNAALRESGVRASPYDIGAVRHVYRLNRDLRFTYKPQFGSRKYSDGFIEWIAGKVQGDKRFFAKARAKWRGEKRRGTWGA